MNPVPHVKNVSPTITTVKLKFLFSTCYYNVWVFLESIIIIQFIKNLSHFSQVHAVKPKVKLQSTYSTMRLIHNCIIGMKICLEQISQIPYSF